MELNEQDLAVVAKIQELRNSTPDAARKMYRRGLQKLANQDVADRAELVWAAITRTAEPASDEEVEAAVDAPKKLTRNERRLAAKAKKEEKKASKPKAAKKAPKKSDGTPRVECALVPLDRDVELSPVSEVKHAFTANLFGKKHVVIWGERNRSGGAAARFESVNLSESRLDAAKKYAKEADLPVAVCVTVRVLGKLDQGYAVPVAVFEKFRHEKSNAFTFSGAARQAYQDDGWAGCKFSVKAAAEKAA